MKIINKPDISKIIRILKSGGLVIMPTETVYGAFVDATNSKAVEKLSKYKKRAYGKPYSVAVSDINMAKEYVFLNDNAKSLYNNFLPGPLTVISKGKGKVAFGVESEEKTLGIRIPDYKLILDIVKKYKKPLTATSANASYQKRPYKISDILENISSKQKNMIDLIYDAGKLPLNEPSTVIDTTTDDPIVLRQGDIKIKNENKILTRSPEETMNFAKNLWQQYEKYQGKRAIVFALEGKMGSGKTIFAKGLAKTLGIKEDIVSPTYDLLINYSTTKNHIEFTHIDVWRITTEDEVNDLMINEKISDKSVIALEWANKIIQLVKKYSDEAIVIWVKIDYAVKTNERVIYWGTI